MFNKITHDFGTVSQQKEYSTSFVSTLPIVAATPDCGCTVANIVNKTLTVSVKIPRIPAAITEDYNWQRRIQVTLKGEEEKMIPMTLVVKAIIKRQECTNS